MIFSPLYLCESGALNATARDDVLRYSRPLVRIFGNTGYYYKEAAICWVMGHASTKQARLLFLGMV